MAKKKIVETTEPPASSIVSSIEDTEGYITAASPEILTIMSTPTADTVEQPQVIKKIHDLSDYDDLPYKMTDKAWTAYVLSSLDPDLEMINGQPTCDGLRRLFNKIAIVHEAKANVVQPPVVDNQSRATVTFTLTYTLLHSPHQRTISESVDVFAGNTDALFAKHPVATACTTAESRCYKKALLLVKVLTVDEARLPDPGEVSRITIEASNQPIKPVQRQVIMGLCLRLNIDFTKICHQVLNKEGVLDVNDLTFNEAQEVISQLSIYNNGPDNKGGAAIPEALIKKA